MSKIKSVEKEKIVAEKLNGRFAMIGFIAAVGAYLTTGQIIPGFVYSNEPTYLFYNCRYSHNIAIYALHHKEITRAFRAQFI